MYLQPCSAFVKYDRKAQKYLVLRSPFSHDFWCKILQVLVVSSAFNFGLKGFLEEMLVLPFLWKGHYLAGDFVGH